MSPELTTARLPVLIANEGNSKVLCRAGHGAVIEFVGLVGRGDGPRSDLDGPLVSRLGLSDAR